MDEPDPSAVAEKPAETKDEYSTEESSEDEKAADTAVENLHGTKMDVESSNETKTNSEKAAETSVEKLCDTTKDVETSNETKRDSEKGAVETSVEKLDDTKMDVDSSNETKKDSDKDAAETSVEKLDDTKEDVESTDKTKTDSASTSEYSADNVHYEGDKAIYTDPKTRYQYQWSEETNQWLPRSDVQYGFEDDTHTYTDAEGVKFFWDIEKKAWFPKIDDEFMARYQMSYGFVDNATPEDKEREEKERKEREEKLIARAKEKEAKAEKKNSLKRKEPPPPPSWFEINEQENTKVYVSNLPTEITEQEFVDLMQKCGLVMKDPISGKMKVKLYTVPGTDILKGDALCSYIRIESVELALKLLDGYVYNGKEISVERAKFEMKGTYDPNLKPKVKKRKQKDKLKKMQEKLFDWRPEKMRGERAKHERIVIVKNLFEPSLFDKDVSLILEYQQDLREECSKLGEVRKVTLFDRHPEGVAQINMKEPEQADECVKLLNGRWFCQRQLTAEIWDGKTKYKIAETDSEITQRIDEWDKFLESDDAQKTAPAVPTEAEKKPIEEST